MQILQRDHIAAVMQVASEKRIQSNVPARDELILASWQRCVHQHGLDPTRMQDAVILPDGRLREHQDRMEEFLHIARHGMETLYQQVAGIGYCVLLTDARGVTVDFLGDVLVESGLRKAGLYLGSDWSEEIAGTCGVGTCITTGQALTVHQGDHFDATHIPLTCTAAPVFDAEGSLNAILDISALLSPQAKQSQHLALQLVKVFAQQIENASFLNRFRRDWVLKLSSTPQFLDMSPEFLLALDSGGRVIGHNRRAQILLAKGRPGGIIGTPLEEILSVSANALGRFVSSQPSDQRAVTHLDTRQVLFMLASPPPALIKAAQDGAITRPIPAQLASLSGGDSVLNRQIERASRLINTPVSVLLTGETGTGKEYFAKALHQSSERHNRPFVAVNCAAIPETLIESELFGHLPGSFSGASTKGKRGLIQEADTGTLFLDEIGDMPRDLQSRLLRVLSEREVLPIGATRPVPVTIRIIAATHCDLEAMVRAGRFREDLYYRLNGACFQLPPLRKRTDLAWLIQHMLNDGSGDPAPELSLRASACLHAYHWPGNLRELRNALDYARAVCSNGRIEIDDLPEFFHANALPGIANSSAVEIVQHSDALLLRQYLSAAHWNVTLVAHQLGISRMTLYRRMKRFGIVSPKQSDGSSFGL